MTRFFLVVISFLTLSFYSQEEKRLALVIGNANYDKGALKNPVNDALLMASTLDTLGFDVILDTNIASRRDFVETIKEFGNKRPNYDVAFVYYAGHGVQVNNENYLLPTKEKFSSHDDVIDYAVSVQRVINYLTSMTDQVNVLILDACRDNPFETNWNATRSLAGSGLAKMQAPSGSMIAFSTTANTTASDGTGNNSVYCKSLAANLQKENTSIDQVFRNVRKDVISQSNGKQTPEEASKLLGEAFYLVKTQKLVLANKVMSLKEDDLSSFLSNYLIESGFKLNSYRDSLISKDTNEFNILIANNTKILEIDQKNLQAYKERGMAYFRLEKFDKAMLDLEDALRLDSTDAEVYFLIGIVQNKLNKIQDAIKFYSKSLQKNPNYHKSYTNRGAILSNDLKDHKLAKLDFEAAIKISPKSVINHISLSVVNGKLGDLKTALENIKYASDLIENKSDSSFLCQIYEQTSRIYTDLKDFKKSEEFISKAIKNDSTNISYYIWLGGIRQANKDFDGAYNSYSKAIKLDSLNADFYKYRAYINFLDFKSDKDAVINDFNKVIELGNSSLGLLKDLSLVYYQSALRKRDGYYTFDGEVNYKGALEDYYKALEIFEEVNLKDEYSKPYQASYRDALRQIMKLKKKLHFNYCDQLDTLNQLYYLDTESIIFRGDCNFNSKITLVPGKNVFFYDASGIICDKEKSKFSRHITLDKNLNPIGKVMDYYTNGKKKMQADSFVSFNAYNSHIFEVRGDYEEYNKKGKLSYECFYSDRFPIQEAYY